MLLAGGIAEAADVRAALDAGADAAVLGTRFLMTHESGAREAYKQRLMESRETVLTELFGAGWPRAPHRVIWNEATERWLKGDRRGPSWVRALHLATAPALARVPVSQQMKLARIQRADRPMLGPLAADGGRPGQPARRGRALRGRERRADPRHQARGRARERVGAGMSANAPS